MTNLQTDILIVGAGMVGASAALGLAHQGYHVSVLEPSPQHEVDCQGAYDLRISAITTDNIRMLDELGVWPELRNLRVQPFNQLAVRKEGQNWLTMGNADKPAFLGYMIENNVLQYALLKALQRHPLIEVIETSVDRLNSEQGWALTESGQRIEFSWVLGCDGAQSKVRQQSGIGVAGRRYGQSCLLTTVQCTDPVAATTWESFADNGEIHAMLPLQGNQACLIMYGSGQQVATWQASQEQLQEVLNARFSREIGDFTLLSHGSFPLTRQTALDYVRQRTILLGDAAHTIHPMAGQGVNLGFRDVRKLLEVLQGMDMADPEAETATRRVLGHYAVARRADNELMAQAMDSIAWGFQRNTGAVPAARNLILAGLQRFKPGRTILSAYASGVWKI
ncbi:2-octaprenyl-3-methyl-6-methoxy-1,4-benzoquinol hydroxylase [Aliidiomarina sedimenti]|uniref:2-octaprenyl-3-methyl-6-methoxy-1,4-benzoquinol hydroxylase n=1 Tax=Aliidiomarina sedimenti TaxID=1933879 RepID=A0ABY0C3A3_9GAMM|nr:FAD-dependent monooxygenase [Aliidiomarina sedimenti]RUO32143.1 2-octaprenyl-3-methyl-6-methoxy-1,4-benzoquinol hydroxylase [Aliidiomarina sedimenti]